MTQDRDQHDERLAQYGEQDGVGKPCCALHQIVDRHPGEHGLHPAPAHQDHDVGRHRQQAAPRTERSAGQRHRRQTGPGADVADERENHCATEGAEHDHRHRGGESDRGNQQRTGQQGGDDEVGGEPDHADPRQ